jgi:hypothetical protein
MVLSGFLENRMKKQSTVASLKDAGYQAAKHGEGMAQVARFVLNECPTFLDGVPDEVKAQLREGQALRWQELNPAIRYTADSSKTANARGDASAPDEVKLRQAIDAFYAKLK